MKSALAGDAVQEVEVEAFVPEYSPGKEVQRALYPLFGNVLPQEAALMSDTQRAQPEPGCGDTGDRPVIQPIHADTV